MSKLLSASVVSELIGMIYDCAIDSQRWPATLTGLREALHFHSAVLALQVLPAGSPLLHATSGIEARWLEQLPHYSAEYIERWGGREKVEGLPLEEPAVLSWINPRANWEFSRYHVEWAKPQGIIDVMAIGLARDAHSVGSLILRRHQDAGEITPDEVDAARIFVPHLQRAVAISRLLDVKTVTAGTLEAVLDSLAIAVVLVTHDLQVMHANRAARLMFAAGDPIHTRDGLLGLRWPGAAAALAGVVARAAADESAIGSKGMNVPIQNSAGQACMMQILPLRQGLLRRGLMPSAIAAIFVAPAASSRPPQMSALSALFGLTHAETSVLEKIASGHNVAQAAAALAISAATIKTHLQHIFDKTGVRRQTDLMALASSFNVPPTGSLE